MCWLQKQLDHRKCPLDCSTVVGVTLASFVLALVFFTSELLLFKTLSWKMALQPMIVAVPHCAASF